MRNQDIRKIAREAKVPLWMIAEKMDVCEMTIVRTLRRNLSPDEKKEIINVISKLKKEISNATN